MLDASDDLPLGIIPLVVDQKINHKYPKLLSIPILNITCNRVHIPRATVFGMLNPIEIESIEVSNISWTKTKKSQDDIRNSQMELPTIPPELSFQWENNKTIGNITGCTSST